MLITTVLLLTLTFCAGFAGAYLLKRQPLKVPAVDDVVNEGSFDLKAQELVETKEQLQLIVESMSDGLITINADGVISAMNNMAGKITGYAPGEGRGIRAETILGDVLEQRARFLDPAETDISHRNGSRVPVELSIRVAVTQRGKVYIVAIHDITELKKTQKQLLQQAHIIERSQSFVFVTNKHHALEWCNPRFEDISGYSAGEMIGSNPTELLFGEASSPQDVQRIREAQKSAASYKAEVLLYSKSLRPFWAQIDAHPILDDRGEVEKYVGMGFDTTERRFAEKLQVDFISMVSHELRTPLTVIAGAFEAMTINPEEQTPEIINMLVEMGQRNCAHLGQLIEDLLDINKMESGTLALKSAPIDIGRIVGLATSELQSIAIDAKVAVELLEFRSIDPVYADPQRVKQVLINLLSNAIKFLASGQQGDRVDSTERIVYTGGD